MTLEQIQQLSDDEIRVRVAEACGWIYYDGWHHPDREGEPLFEGELPNYPADLNACHELERMLTCGQAWEYNRHLSCLLGTAAGMGSGVVDEWSWHATARQRCEAFLAVMGKEEA